MLTKRLKTLFLAPVIALLLMGAAVLEDPPPVPVPDGMTLENVEKGIRMALINRGWIPKQSETKGQMEAVLNVRRHTAVVTITYDTKNIQAAYKDSVNLGYEEKGDVRTIHKNYGKWVNTMLNDIQRELMIMSH